MHVQCSLSICWTQRRFDHAIIWKEKPVFHAGFSHVNNNSNRAISVVLHCTPHFLPTKVEVLVFLLHFLVCDALALPRLHLHLFGYNNVPWELVCLKRRIVILDSGDELLKKTQQNNLVISQLFIFESEVLHWQIIDNSRARGFIMYALISYFHVP